MACGGGELLSQVPYWQNLLEIPPFGVTGKPATAGDALWNSIPSHLRMPGPMGSGFTSSTLLKSH